MSKRRLVITAVLAGRSQSEVARTYGVSQGWISRLMARYRESGEAAFEPLSRAPKTTPGATDQASVQLVVELRTKLALAGLDAGADTIGWHLHHHHKITLSRATINRILVRAGLVTPDPSKRPKSSYIRFEAEQPNECWQSDFTHYRLTRPDGTTGADVEIITWLDDHSRYALHLSAHARITGPIVLASFTTAAAQYGHPASTLTDNGMVYTVRFAGGRGGRTGLETELRRLGIVQKNSRPNHPTTCGKVERFQQTLKKWLRAQPDRPPPSPSSKRCSTSSSTSTTSSDRTAPCPIAAPGCRLPCPAQSHPRRQPRPATATTASATDKIDKSGTSPARHNGRLHHIGIGRTHAGTYVRLLRPRPRRAHHQRRHRRSSYATGNRHHPRLPTTADHPDPQNDRAEPTHVGSAVRCPETSHGRDDSVLVQDMEWGVAGDRHR